MLLEQVFMVRGGDRGAGLFNTNFEVKILYFVLVLVVILYDWRTMKRKDYFRVLTTGTIVWSFVELVLQLTGMRELSPVTVFSWEIPFLVQVVLKGAVEGAGVAIVCLFFSDRLLVGTRGQRIGWQLVFLAVLVLLVVEALWLGPQVPNYGGDVPSRRAMVAIVPLLFLAVFTGLAIWWVATTPHADLRRRAIWMFAFMVIYGGVWTLAEYGAGTRWIEVGLLGDSRHAPPLVEALALLFDVFIEIAAVYVPFFAIPVMTGDLLPAGSSGGKKRLNE
jgi:hypothetical protein